MQERRYRSLFWPVLLIGVGIVWLLANLGYVQPVSINAVLRLWPILLIVVGLDILIGRRSALLGAIIGLLAVGAVIAILLFGTTIGINDANGVITERFNTPIAEAKSARLDLSLGDRHTNIYALSDSDDLIDATLTHAGTIQFDVSGTTEKLVKLSQVWDGGMIFFDGNMSGWEIGLTPSIPLDLTVDGGSGSSELNLSTLKLNSLNIDMASGSSRIQLPGGDSYEAKMESGSGSFQVTIPENADLVMYVDSGSGSVDIRLPADAAVRVEVRDDGSGKS